MADEEETIHTLTPSQISHLTSQLSIYTSLTSDFPIELVQQVSKSERSTPDSSLTYGELVLPTQDFLSFAEMIELCKSRFHLSPGGTFVDLGSVTFPPRAPAKPSYPQLCYTPSLSVLVSKFYQDYTPSLFRYCKNTVRAAEMRISTLFVGRFWNMIGQMRPSFL